MALICENELNGCYFYVKAKRQKGQWASDVIGVCLNCEPLPRYKKNGLKNIQATFFSVSYKCYEPLLLYNNSNKSMIVIAPTDTTPQYLIIAMEAQCNAPVGLCYLYVHFSVLTCLKGNTSMLEHNAICYPLRFSQP